MFDLMSKEPQIPPGGGGLDQFGNYIPDSASAPRSTPAAAPSAVPAPVAGGKRRSSSEALDQMTLLNHAASAITAIQARLYVEGSNGSRMLRSDIPIREVKDTMTAISTLLKSIRDSEAGVRQEMSNRLFKKAVVAVLAEMDAEGQSHFVERLRELEGDMRRSRLDRAA